MLRSSEVAAQLIVFRLVTALLNKYAKSVTLNAETHYIKTLYAGKKGKDLLLVQ